MNSSSSPAPESVRTGSPDLVLIGLRGSGKTTLGKHLAAELWRKFIDLDALVLERLDKPTILEAWNEFGEAKWRETEAQVMRELYESPAAAVSDSGKPTDRVIATGGGAPVVESVRNLLNEQKRAQRVKIVYLDCDPAVLCRRLAAEFGESTDTSRPALTDQPNLLSEIQAVKNVRDPTYRDLAHKTIDVSTLAIPDIAGWIIRNCL